MLSLNTNKIRYHGSGVFSNGDDEMFENFEETENALHPDQNELTGKTLDEKEVLIIEMLLVKYDLYLIWRVLFDFNDDNLTIFEK